jgi:hypothetical protein
VKFITLSLSLTALGTQADTLTTLDAQGSAPARPYVTVYCAPAKGINLSAEKDSTPGKAAEMLLDPASGGYVSRPASTHRFSYTINQDGSAAQTMFLDGGRLVTNQMHIVGKVNRNAMSFTVGSDGNVTLLSFYPDKSLVITVLAGSVADMKFIPVGSVYLSRCTFSWATS